jgi:hypothetical protein
MRQLPARLAGVGRYVTKWDGANWACAEDVDTETTYAAGTGLDLTGTTFTITDTYSLSQGCSDGQLVSWDGSSLGCAEATAGDSSWLLTGNGGTTPGVNFLGTTDGVSLTLVLSGATALRLESATMSPSVVGGSGANSVRDGVNGAAIGGGFSAEADFNLAGTIGQADGGPTMSGGNYTVIGGFGSAELAPVSSGEPYIYLPVITSQ